MHAQISKFYQFSQGYNVKYHRTKTGDMVLVEAHATRWSLRAICRLLLP